MADAGSNVRGLLQRALHTGIAPALVAEWGSDASGVSREVLGAAELFPERTDATRETWFDLASLTKPLVTTSLCLVAFRSGVIDASTCAGEVLDELRGTKIGDLEVGWLLTHTSGLPAWLPLYCLAEGQRENLFPGLARVDLQTRPGERVDYSCVGFVILGLMLARLSDLPLDALFRREILDPLGIGDELGFCTEVESRSLSGGATRPVVEGRLVNDLGFERGWIPPMVRDLPDDGNARFLGGVAGNAGLFGTAHGVRTLSSEYLPGGGALLTAEEAELATGLKTPGLEQGRSWGWQIAFSPGSSAGPGLSKTSFGHTGFTGVSVWCDPVNRGVYVMLSNRNHPSQRENDLHPLRRRFHALAAAEL